MYARVKIVLLAVWVVLSAVSPALAQGMSTWFLAEGANNSMFREEILVGNPNGAALDVTVTLLPQPGATATTTSKVFRLAATSRLTVRLSDDFGLSGSSSARVSAVLADTTTPADIVVERSMYFPNGTNLGAHNAGGVTTLAPRWTLAEGSSSVFDTFILVANPNPTTTLVRATYLTSLGQQYVTEITAPANGRINFWPAEEHSGLKSADFSTFVESLTPGNDVVAERAMYFDGYQSGHDALGIPDASTTWLFAEGYTGGNPAIAFETFLLLANTGDVATTATVDYLLDSGQVVTRDYSLPARSRTTVWVDDEGRTFDSRLTAAAFGIRVTAQAPIVAERAMYWGSPSVADPTSPSWPWKEGHATAGVTTTSAKWGFAEGQQGSFAGIPFDSFFLLANPNPTSIAVRATFVREDGLGIVRDTCVSANARANIWTTVYPELVGYRFAAFLETVASQSCGGAGGEGFVAERAMYVGNAFVAGHVNVGTAWAGVIVAPPVAPEPPPPPQVTLAVTSVSPSAGRLGGGQDITITGTDFKAGARVYFVNPDWTSDYNASLPRVNECTSVVVHSDTRITCRTPPRTFYSGYQTAGPATVRVVNGDSATADLANGYTFRFNVLAFGDEVISGVPGRLRDLLAGYGKQYLDPNTGSPSGGAVLQFGNHVSVTDGGSTGECASGCGGASGAQRFAGRADSAAGSVDAYDAVVILEGIYDVRGGYGSGGARNGLRNILTAARDRGIVVVLTRLMSGTDLLNTTQLNDLGAQIWALSEENLGMEVYRQSLEGIASGGTYPSSAGYDTMAGLIRDKVAREFPLQACDARSDKPGHGCPRNP